MDALSLRWTCAIHRRPRILLALGRPWRQRHPTAPADTTTTAPATCSEGYSVRVVPRQKSAMLRAVSRLTSGAAIGKISVACIVPIT